MKSILKRIWILPLATVIALTPTWVNTFFRPVFPVWAQVSNPGVIGVASAPSGSCGNGLPMQMVVSTGALYSCQGGTWAEVGGSSGAYLPLTGGTLTGGLTIAPATGDAQIGLAPTGATAFTMGVANQANPAWYLLDGYRGTVDFAVLNGNAIGGSAYAGALIGNSYGIIGFAATNNAQQATYSDASFNRYAAGTLGVCSTSTYACDTGSLIAANLTATNAMVSGNTRTTVYTVSTLPAASSLAAGTMVEVSDATTFTPGTCTGGGSDYMIAITNGTAWSCH